MSDSIVNTLGSDNITPTALRSHNNTRPKLLYANTRESAQVNEECICKNDDLGKFLEIAFA